MSLKAIGDGFIDWFIPAKLLADREMRIRARMFLFSHLLGPFLGNVIPGYLFFLDPSSTKLAVLAGSITSFWLYPLALRLTGRYELLCYLSIQNLLFAILWGCYFYGGVSSPFLPWLATVPLLAFFYLGATPRSCATILLLVASSCVFFVFEYKTGGGLRSSVPISDLQGIGVISIVSASVYVTMMALFYARILDSQAELEVEAHDHLTTAAALRTAAAHAERAKAAKAEFLAKMSHELRTPLNAVIGYSQILLEDADREAEPQIVADLDRIHSAGTHLLMLVNSILDLSKIDAGKMEVYREPVVIADIVAEVVDRFSDAQPAAAANLTFAVDPSVGAVVTDAPKVTRVLEALIGNALAYAPQAPIAVRARRVAGPAGGAIEIVVADRGPGIAPDVLPTLFEDFTKRSDQSASKYAGAGLGLPLSWRLCNLLGGTLAIESEPGRGTRAVATIPDHAEPRADAPPVLRAA